MYTSGNIPCIPLTVTVNQEMGCVQTWLAVIIHAWHAHLASNDFFTVPYTLSIRNHGLPTTQPKICGHNPCVNEYTMHNWCAANSQHCITIKALYKAESYKLAKQISKLLAMWLHKLVLTKLSIFANVFRGSDGSTMASWGWQMLTA